MELFNKKELNQLDFLNVQVNNKTSGKSDTYENKTVTYAGYFKNMGKGPVDSEIIIPDADLKYFKWQKFGADSSMNKLLKEVCKIR